MNLEEAKVIYGHPKGYSTQELHQCLDVLNSQPHDLTEVQALVIEDAHRRLGIPLEVIREEPVRKEVT